MILNLKDEGVDGSGFTSIHSSDVTSIVSSLSDALRGTQDPQDLPLKPNTSLELETQSNEEDCSCRHQSLN